MQLSVRLRSNDDEDNDDDDCVTVNVSRRSQDFNCANFEHKFAYRTESMRHGG